MNSTASVCTQSASPTHTLSKFTRSGVDNGGPFETELRDEGAKRERDLVLFSQAIEEGEEEVTDFDQEKRVNH